MQPLLRPPHLYGVSFAKGLHAEPGRFLCVTQLTLERERACLTSSASLGLTEHSQVDVLDVEYESVICEAEKSSGTKSISPNTGVPRSYKKHPPPQDHHRSLGIGPLQGPTRGVFLMSEVTLQ